ncbi:MAG: InlB B-repeat-containing protein [Oscillospiraceae bacterium]|nr:InlB B-repeat-containing protein [Oscillospiraceae bacterium]
MKQCSNPNTSAYIHAGDDTNHNRCIGGLVGQFDSGTVENCYSRSLVWGGNRVGGLLGTSGKVTMKQCFCYAPDSNSHFNKEDGVDCEKIKMEGTVYCGALIGETTDSYTLQNCIWYWSCCSWAIDGGGDSHDDIWHDYGWWKVTSNFKTKSQFPSQYDFNNVWTTQNDSSVAALRFEVNDTIYNNPPDPQSPDPLSISIGAPPDKPGPDVDVTEARTISIFTVDDLKALRDAVNGGDTYENATILLCADLDLGDENWTPIGENTDVISFNGTFEGRGHTISGLNANITDTRTAGLFGNIGAAGAVRDLAVSGTVSLVISGGISEYAGGIAGYSKGAVERCVFDGEVTGSSEGLISGFGGIVGYCASSGSVKNCRHSGGVNGGKNAGGIVGYCAGNTENCVHIGGTVSASDNKGGVAGRVNDGSVINCYALTGSASGIVGYAGLSGAFISGSMLSAYELSMQSSYVSFGSHSWNFNSVWAMGERYPLLRCMSETVTLDPNGGAGSVTTVWKPRGGARLPESGFTRDGFVFTGWNTKNDGLGTEYADRAVIDRSVTLYAQWLEGTPYAGYIPMTVTDGYAGVKAEENYTKLLDGNINTKWCVGGDGVQNGDAFSIEFAAPDYIEPCACAITTGNDAQKYPERNPLKWTLEAKAHAGGEWVLLARSRDDETLPPLNNATMYKPLYTEGEYCYFRLTFRGVSSGNTFQLSEFALLTKTAARQPLISFDPQGGVGAVQTMNAAAESLLVLPGNTYTREGFDFAGWNTAADGSGDAYAAGEGYPVAGDATLYAQWTESTCTVRFLDEDGTSELSTVTVKAGRVPLYNGTAPEKASTATKSYTFTGWTPAVKAVTGNTDYLATFSEEERTYTVTWISGGALLEYDSGISYDTPPQYNGAVPTKPDDTEHTYTFSGWSDGANVYSLTDPLPNVTDDVTFTAQFASAPRKYNITWENWDGTVLRVDPVDYGAAPDYGGEPTRDADAQYSYAFSGWSPAVAAVTGEAKYTAQYTPALRSYTVTWLNYDGTPLRSDENVDYGTVPDYGSVPERPATASTEYTFTEWYPAIQPVSGDATYTAQFGDSTRCYTVKWMNGDSLLEEAPVPYGAMPVYHGAAPVKEDEGYYTYTFAGWTPEVGSVVGEATYSAVFDQATVSFNVHYRSNGALGTMDSASVLRGLTHTLPDSGFTAPSGMIFDTWEIGGAHYAPGDVYTVCADTDVTALWKNLYTVTWVNHDGKLLQSDIVPQGDMPLYTGKEPTKPSDAEYDYAFAGWTPAVTAADGDITYTAVFADVPRTYTVTWKDRDGNVLETDTNVPYGAVPSFDADIPETFDDDLFIYDFLGWSPEVTPVECDAVYTAQYQKTRIEYERDEPYIQQFASSVDAPAGGRIRISPLNAVKGKTVTLTAEPLDGWQLAQLKVYRKSGAKTDIELTDKGSGVFTFTMPDRKIMIDVLFEPIDLLAMFPDLRPNAWYLDDVRWAVSHGVMRGTDRGFEPNGTTSFAMVAQMLLNVDCGFAPTADAGGSDKWYDECMAWLNENGLAKGIPGSIDPNGTISREQVAVLLYNFAAYRGLDVSAAGSLDGFTDADSVSAWAADAMRWAVSSGIVNGMGDGTVDPGGSTTRAQIAALIRRSSGKIGYR